MCDLLWIFGKVRILIKKFDCHFGVWSIMDLHTKKDQCHKTHKNQRRIQDFPEGAPSPVGGVGERKSIIWHIFCWKLHKNKKIGLRGCARNARSLEEAHRGMNQPTNPVFLASRLLLNYEIFCYNNVNNVPKMWTLAPKVTMTSRNYFSERDAFSRSNISASGVSLRKAVHVFPAGQGRPWQ